MVNSDPRHTVRSVDSRRRKVGVSRQSGISPLSTQWLYISLRGGADRASVAAPATTRNGILYSASLCPGHSGVVTRVRDIRRLRAACDILSPRFGQAAPWRRLRSPRRAVSRSPAVSSPGASRPPGATACRARRARRTARLERGTVRGGWEVQAACSSLPPTAACVCTAGQGECVTVVGRPVRVGPRRCLHVEVRCDSPCCRVPDRFGWAPTPLLCKSLPVTRVSRRAGVLPGGSSVWRGGGRSDVMLVESSNGLSSRVMGPLCV